MTENSSYDTYDADVYGTDTSVYDEPMVGPLDAPDTGSGLHPVNITQLVLGVAFAGMVLVWALVQGDVVETSELRWLMPIPWIAAGAAGLAATVWPGRRA
ncbi:hypothetical protein EUA06_08420 [Nocardioides glacieisoli]|uniref:Uncharacterized protein n=1 Tax=Nocardioides glacieisoli TaxID=1168730 RepID=A0A4Q2RU16_9ACTN|nr:hypothetical protein [Nocardioides glacieisoli]RYB91345.1 hypothetical protein EUA06_08420 [Nocardioides glacieisoli]